MMFKWSTLFFLLIVVAAVTVEAGKKGCKPGDRWREDCHRCHCTKVGTKACTRELCPPKSGNRRGPVRSYSPPTCVPGKKWKEDCNNCICGKDGQPECSRMMCSALRNRRKNRGRPSPNRNQQNRNIKGKGKKA